MPTAAGGVIWLKLTRLVSIAAVHIASLPAMGPRYTVIPVIAAQISAFRPSVLARAMDVAFRSMTVVTVEPFTEPGMLREGRSRRNIGEFDERWR